MQNINRLNHLVNILRNLQNEEARWILSDMEDDIRFEKGNLAYLARHIFNPLDLFKELSLDELKLLFHPLKEETAFPILNQKSDNRKEIKELLPKIFSKNKLDDIKLVQNPEPLDIATEKILDRLFKLVADGKVAYTGICSYIYPTYCRKEGEKRENKVTFKVLNPLVAPGEGLKILVYASGQAGKKVTLSLQTRGKRFFDKENWLSYIPLDSNGFFFGEVFPMREEGPVTVWLNVPEIGETCRTVFFTPSARSLFALDILDVSREEGKVSLLTKIMSKEKATEQNLRFIVYCTRCGSPLSVSSAKVTNGEAKLVFSSENLENHLHDYYLHAFYGEHQTGVYLNVFSEKEKIESIESSDRKPGESIHIKFKDLAYQKLFYHVSISQYTNRKLEALLNSSRTKVHGSAQENYQRKASPIELAILEEEITLLSELKSQFEFGVVGIPEDGNFYYTPKNLENVSDIYITFYKFSQGTISPFLRCRSLLTKEAVIYPILPKYIEKNEKVQIDVAYSVPQNAKIISRNGKEEIKNVMGKGLFPVWLDGEPVEIDLQIDGNGSSIQKIIESNPRKIQRTYIEYKKPGSVIQKNQDELELFDKPETLHNFVLDSLLLNYPWGCGEQTAAKIAGLGMVMIRLLPVNKTHPLIIKLKEGVKTLKEFKASNGHYSIFQGSTADNETTGIIYNNLNLISKDRKKLEQYIPELFVVMDEMREKLSEEKVPNKFGKGRVESFLPVDDLEKMKKLFPRFIQLESDKLTTVNGSYQSLTAFASIASSSLLKNKSNQIKVFAGKKRSQTEIQSSGLRGFFESIGWLKRKTQSEVQFLTKELNNALDYLLPACRLSYFKDGFPSTIDMIAMLLLFNQIKSVVKNYQYQEQGDNVKIESPFTFIKNKTEMQFTFEKGKSLLRPSKSRLQKGEVFSLDMDRKQAKFTDIYYLLLPSCLEPVQNQNHIYHDEEQKLSFHPFGTEQNIYLKGVRRGKGKLLLISESMNDTSKSEFLEVGNVEVV